MKIKILFIIAISLIMIQCGSYSDTTTVQVSWNSEDTAAKDTYDGDPPDDAKEIIISVYADQYSSGNLIFQETYSSELNSAEIEVISGNDRIFVVEAKEANGLISYRGISGKIDLVSDETTTVTITMESVPIETATLNITLEYDGGSFISPLPTELLNDTIRLSIVTRNSPIFDQPIEDIEISCDTDGDYDNFNYDVTLLTSDTIPNITVPARSFILIVLRGNYSGAPNERLRYIGLVDPADTSNLEPDSVNDVVLEVVDGVIDTSVSSAIDSNWKEYCKCGT